MTEELLRLQEPEYAAFQRALIPTLPPEKILGVRTPKLRALARQMEPKEAEAFLQTLPHRWYEENQLHAFLLERLREYDWCIRELDRFLPYVDNWATCDSLSPKVLGKHRAELLPEIQRWLASPHPYTVRFAIGMLMRWYLDDAFSPTYLRLVAQTVSEDYYVNMMVAWYFATALAKQYAATLPFLQTQQLRVRTHNQTIRKALESRRITPEQKRMLRTLKRKQAD